MSGFVYIWRDKKRSKYYIGSHWGSPDDGYICSSSIMKSAYNKRPEDFKRRIIATITTSRADLLSEEERWLQMINPNEVGIKYYNLHRITHHWHGDPDNLRDVRAKLSRAGIGRPVSDETRRKIREGNVGQTRSDDFKARRSELNKIIHTGMKRSPETAEKIRQSKLGKKLSPETIAKIKESMRRSHLAKLAKQAV